MIPKAYILAAPAMKAAKAAAKKGGGKKTADPSIEACLALTQYRSDNNVQAKEVSPKPKTVRPL